MQWCVLATLILIPTVQCCITVQNSIHQVLVKLCCLCFRSDISLAHSRIDVCNHQPFKCLLWQFCFLNSFEKFVLWDFQIHFYVLKISGSGDGFTLWYIPVNAALFKLNQYGRISQYSNYILWLVQHIPNDSMIKPFVRFIWYVPWCVHLHSRRKIS